MASTVFQPTLTTIVVAMTIAIATIAKCADDNAFNAVTTSQLGKEKFIVKTTVTPSPNYECQKAANPKYRVVVRNGTAIKCLSDETETATTESPTRAAHCNIKEAADIELGALLDAGEGAMVTLIAGDTRLMAHRAVLAARSPGFAAMLCHGAQEASSGEMAIPDMEGPVLRQLVAYLYTLQAPQLPGMAPQLLAAADKFGLSSLKAECEVHVASQLSVETAAATAVLAIRHSSTTLRQAAIAFIKAHLVQVIATRGWANAARYHPEEMAEVYRVLIELLLEASTPAAAVNHTTTKGPSLPESSQGQTPVAAVPVSQPTTTAPSPPHTSHGQTPLATASPSPPTSAPDYSAVCPLWSLSSEEKGRKLIKAATQGRLGEVEALLAAGADVGARDGSGNAALDWAAYMGQVKVVRRLLQAGAEVDARDYGQRTALHDAAWSGHTDAVRLLLASSANPNARDGKGRMPLHWAAQQGHEEVVAALLEAGADTGVRDSAGKTPLDLAREHNKQHILQLLT